jgi:DNA-directed RNA polymerase subunit RPC12/RpoP
MSASEQRVEVSCRSCGAEILFEPLQRTARCPYCDSPSVVDRPARPDRPDPVFGLGFIVTADDAARRLRKWIRGRKMEPFGLKKKTAEKVKGVYLPTYLYSATAYTNYNASIAEHYKDEDKERKTEYRDLAGRHATYVADILVTASRGLPNDEIEGIEPFDLGALSRYTPALVSGWISEEPSLTQEKCRELARREARAHVEKRLRDFMPGDGVGSLRHQTSLEDESIDLTLVPVWVSAIRYDEKKPPIRVLVNGQTGRVFGKVPFSWAKLGLIAAGILILIGLGRLLWGLLQ